MINFKQIDEARKILGLDEEASIEEIKDVFRKLALKYHPDRCKDKDKKRCEEIFKDKPRKGYYRKLLRKLPVFF